MSDATWTPQEVKRIVEMAGNGIKAQAIADNIGTHSRNAVLGKLHRLGVKIAPKKVKPPPKRAMAAKAEDFVRSRGWKPSSPEARLPPPLAKVVEVEGVEAVRAEDHKSWMCQCRFDGDLWCSGERARYDTRFGPKTSTWCELHRQKFTVRPKESVR